MADTHVLVRGAGGETKRILLTETSTGSAMYSISTDHTASNQDIIDAITNLTEAGVDTGIATTGSTTNTLVDAGKDWFTDAYEKLCVEITEGTGEGQIRRIVSNTDTVLTIDGSWTTVPDTTSQYKIAFFGKMASDITHWGGTAQTGRDLSLDLAALVNDSANTGATGLYELKDLLDDLTATGTVTGVTNLADVETKIASAATTVVEGIAGSGVTTATLYQLKELLDNLLATAAVSGTTNLADIEAAIGTAATATIAGIVEGIAGSGATTATQYELKQILDTLTATAAVTGSTNLANLQTEIGSAATTIVGGIAGVGTGAMTIKEHSDELASAAEIIDGIVDGIAGSGATTATLYNLKLLLDDLLATATVAGSTNLADLELLLGNLIATAAVAGTTNLADIESEIASAATTIVAGIAGSGASTSTLFELKELLDDLLSTATVAGTTNLADLELLLDNLIATAPVAGTTNLADIEAEISSAATTIVNGIAGSGASTSTLFDLKELLDDLLATAAVLGTTNLADLESELADINTNLDPVEETLMSGAVSGSASMNVGTCKMVSLQIEGTFGTGASVEFEVSNNNSTYYGTVATNVTSIVTDLTTTVAGIYQVDVDGIKYLQVTIDSPTAATDLTVKAYGQ